MKTENQTKRAASKINYFLFFFVLIDGYSCNEIDVRIINGLEHDSCGEMPRLVKVILKEASQSQFPKQDVIGRLQHPTKQSNAPNRYKY